MVKGNPEILAAGVRQKDDDSFGGRSQSPGVIPDDIVRRVNTWHFCHLFEAHHETAIRSVGVVVAVRRPAGAIFAEGFDARQIYRLNNARRSNAV
jgi:hypothetical protein